MLGGAEVKLVEHVGAYATFARDGVRLPQVSILRVEDAQGKVLEEWKPSEGTKAMEPNIAQTITDVLADNAARSYVFGPASYLQLGGRPVAAKTGTTNDYHDGWTLGYTPSLAVGVWTGNNDNAAMKKGADGSKIAAPIWNAFMKKILAGTPVETFKKPKAVKVAKPILNGKFEVEQDVKIDRVTQKVIPVECIDQYPKEFVATKKIKSVHDTLFWINKDDPRGPEPKDPKKDPQFTRWEEAAQSWAKKNNYLTPDIPKEQCGLRDKPNLPAVTITSPQPNDTVTGDSVLVSATVSAPRTIIRVEYFLDGLLVGQTTALPHQFTVPLTGITNGFHDISLRATDDIGGFTNQVVTLNVLTNSPTAITINLPSPAIQLTAGDFPYTISATVADADGVAMKPVQTFRPRRLERSSARSASWSVCSHVSASVVKDR